MDSWEEQREQDRQRFARQLAELRQQREALDASRRRLTSTVQGYLLAGVPLSVMLDELGWSVRTYYRRKAELDQ